ncbi:MAG: hypothetical protein HN702_01365 [Flavobacteriales bacterium]|jgi:hypothetical protein|nr:hypothetical protein [Flavobacteriales bacterium]MBT4477962.1 hypothetical protein [Flavobacteriales bacterium]MBT5354759.1 hypothetical protein [Flavobacteriales bacterium]MBT7619442.1 hypothetical protein [Flavobacteriales bacterium]MBT7726018.1 hypothetical protein [Flavobacteriales bacterium]
MKKLFFIFILISSISFSQTAILDTNTILIGDQIELNISVELNLNEEYNWPEFTDSVYKKVEIISQSDLKEDTTENSKIISQQILLTCFDSGSYYLPPIVFNKNKKTEGLLLNVNTIAINDSSAMMDITDTKIGTKDDYTAEEIEEKERNFWKRIAWIIGILMLLFLIYYLIKKYKKGESVITKRKIIVPPHITALNKLQNLQKKKLWQKGELKEYYSELSLILREYTENRFNFQALELPTSDITKNLKQIDSNILSKLEFVLLKADNIKYAKGLSLEEENKESMKKSKEFIQLTKIEKDESSK